MDPSCRYIYSGLDFFHRCPYPTLWTARGPKPERLKLRGRWQDLLGKALKKQKPAHAGAKKNPAKS